MAKMTEDRLKSIVKAEILSSVGYIGGNLSEQRRTALDYYNQEPFGGELEGRSQYVTSDVQDTVEALVPDLMEIFAGSDEIVRFQPRKPEDVPVAEQATEYIQFIWNNDNDGFTATHDAIKDALLQKNGILKIWWDASPIEKRETLTGINSLALAELDADEDIEIVEQEERQAEAEELQFAPDGLVYDLTIIKRTANGRVRLQAVPPEEFLISRRAVDIDGASFTGHKVKRTRSELRLMGYPEKIIDRLPTYSEEEFNEERVNRFNNDEEWPDAAQTLDEAQQEIWVYECYLLTDWDGDGISEMRQVTVAGPGYEVLENKPVDDHPFVSITPIRMPHKFFGRSMADLVGDIQKVKSTLVRQLLDNLYFMNNGRTALSNKVNIEDWLTMRPGGAVRVDSDAADVQGHLVPIQTAPVGQVVLPSLEYFDAVRETRTGITRYNQGLDAESLNKTATGISQILNQSQRRMMLIARLFAETGFKPAFKKILRLVVNHQDRPRVIRLRNQWVPMDPRDWDVEMDVSISVGLGHGTSSQRALMARSMLEVQAMVIQYQGGVNGPLVDINNIYNSLKTFQEANGFKGNQFFSDPQGKQAEPPPPSPEAQAAMQQLQIEQQRVETERQKMQLNAQEAMQKLQQDQQQFMEEMRLKWAELEAKYAVEGQKVLVDKSRLDLDGMKIQQDGESEVRKLQFEAERDRNGSNTNFDAASFTNRMASINELLMNLSAGMEEAKNTLTRPKKIVRDDNGRIAGAQ